jgi:hypothetical protein
MIRYHEFAKIWIGVSSDYLLYEPDYYRTIKLGNPADSDII